MKRSITDGISNLPGARPAAGDLDRVAPESQEAAGILFRTTIGTRQLLRQVALEERSSVQALLTEAVVALLINRGRGPAA
jgi:hypothetical protein